jgi:hypothetical protein
MDSTDNTAEAPESLVGGSIGARLDEISDTSREANLICKAFGKASEITEANLVLLAQATSQELAKKPEERDAKLLAQYFAIALRARDLDLKDSAHQLCREKHYYDLARKSLEFVAQPKDINDGEEDEREKIQKAILLLFGEDAIGFELPKEQEVA